MAFDRKEEDCHVCGLIGRVTRKWVLNKYGTRYEYLIYRHDGFVHYFNQYHHNTKRFKKGELEKILIETISGKDFKAGLFQIADLKKQLVKEFQEAGFCSLKTNLDRLSDLGILEKLRRGRNLYYINSINKERLSFLDDSMSIALEDVTGDGMLKKHVLINLIKNDHSWPLYYLPYRIVGDVETSFEDLEFYAYDLSNSKEIKAILLEDAPTDKRLLLKLVTPLFPDELRNLKLEYSWQEPKQLFVFSSATRMNNFDFTISGNNPLKPTVTLTSSGTETKNISKDVIESSSEKWNFIYSVSLMDIEPFSVIQIKWKNYRNQNEF